MYKILLIFVTSLLLQGCFGEALIAGSAAGGAVVASGRTMQALADDEKIIYQANRIIASHKAVDAESRIIITSYNRQVLIVGETPRAEWSEQIAQWVRDIPKVRSVYNRLTIAEPIGINVQGNDGLITTNVKTRMMATTNLRAREIKVITENGTVYLMGLVTKAQAQAAAEIARNSTGVKRVVKIFELIDDQP